jgi:hypothetical protein
LAPVTFKKLVEAGKLVGRAIEQQELRAAAAPLLDRLQGGQAGAGTDRAGTPPQDNLPGGLELIAGGFSYRSRPYDLTGRPLAMLTALLTARQQRLTAVQLLETMRVNDETVGFPEQVVRDTAKTLRKALRQAVAAAGEECKNPLPSKGRGENVTYALRMP